MAYRLENEGPSENKVLHSAIFLKIKQRPLNYDDSSPRCLLLQPGESSGIF